MSVKSRAVSPPRPGPRTKVSELESHLGYWLRFVSNHVSHSFQSMVEANGVTVSEWVFLRELYRLGSTSPGELAAAIGMTRGAVSKLMTRLQDKNLVTRSVTEADRRLHAVALTPEGQALVPVLARLADQNDEAFFGHMPEQTRNDILAAMKDIVRIHHLKAVPVD